MKNMLSLVPLYLLISCNAQSNETTDGRNITTDSLNTGACETALRFANSYIGNTGNINQQKTDSSWLYVNTTLTEIFKSKYRMLVDSANKADPEFGLGFDPILDAQDFPDKGFEMKDCKPESGYVTLQGKDWKDFYLVIKVIQQDNIWKVDGSGVINIPPDKRIKK